MSVPQIERSVSLYSDHGGSDKVYNIQIVKEGDGYMVHYQNGKKGATLTPGKKTASPVSLDAAIKIFEKLEKEKRNGSSHYRPIDADPDSYVAPVGDRELSGLMPQLLTAILDEELEAKIKNPNIVFQQKYDGERLQTEHKKEVIRGSNKLGFVRGVPEVLKKDLAAYPETDFDGEIIGNTFYVFDLTRLDGKDMRNVSYLKRLEALDQIFRPSPNMVLVKTYRTEAEKRAALLKIREARGEGIVGKDLNETYFEGRSKTAIKFKFKESATCFVMGHSKAKRSVIYGLSVNGVDQELGKVTIPANHAIPDKGDLIEIEYLYAFVKTHALSQATYKGPRTDQDRSSCVVTQLKYKSGPVSDDDDEEELVVEAVKENAPAKRKAKA